MRRNLPAVIIVLLASIGAILAAAALQAHQFDGEAVVQICEKDDTGHWRIVDELYAPLGFSFSLADKIRERPLSSDYIFSGRSKHGLTVSARLKTGAATDYDARTGIATLTLPLDVWVNGAEVIETFNFTTETATGVMGPISGRRAEINTNGRRTAKLAMVSSTLIQAPQDEKKELLVVIRGDGTVR